MSKEFNVVFACGSVSMALLLVGSAATFLDDLSARPDLLERVAQIRERAFDAIDHDVVGDVGAGDGVSHPIEQIGLGFGETAGTVRKLGDLVK